MQPLPKESLIFQWENVKREVVVSVRSASTARHYTGVHHTCTSDQSLDVYCGSHGYSCVTTMSMHVVKRGFTMTALPRVHID